MAIGWSMHVFLFRRRVSFLIWKGNTSMTLWNGPFSVESDAAWLKDCNHPMKYSKVLCSNCAGVDQEAGRATRGALVTQAWNLAKAAGVELPRFDECQWASVRIARSNNPGRRVRGGGRSRIECKRRLFRVPMNGQFFLPTALWRAGETW